MNKLKPLGRALTVLAIVACFGYGFYGLFTYVLPMSSGDYLHARQSLVADQSEVLINGAESAYRDGHVKEATRVLEQLLDRLVDQGGHYRLVDRWKVVRVEFMLGKCYQTLKQGDKAVQAYEQTLRLDPGHMAAKYNLEMLKRAGGGSGSGSQPKPGKRQPRI